jgi:Ser/Thr protein kinase RdoA (MazF antagonist)
MKALESYGLEDAKLKFHTYTGNGIYKVFVPSDRKSKSSIPPGVYTLRLHQLNYMKPKYISSELEWLSALRDAGIQVPKPFKNLGGSWLTKVDSEYNVPQERNCSLISWVEGRLLKKNFHPHHFKSLGRVIGRMHEQSIGWKPPKGFSRPHWDWRGLFDYDYGIPGEDARSAIPKVHQPIFNEALNLFQETFNQLGKGKRIYGLIHADLGVSDNVVYHAGEARPLDFDDCGFGYWLFDFGVVLSQYISDFNDKSPIMRDALIEGYMETTPLSNLDFDCLDLFIATRYAQFMYFYQAAGLHSPQHMDEANKEVNMNAKHLKRILKKLR